MKDKLQNLLSSFTNRWNQTKFWSYDNRLLIFSFLFSFVLMFCFIAVTMIRNTMIHSFKTELLKLEKHLNEFQLDLAYDNIEFNNIFFYPLVKIDNLQIYNLQGRELWKINIATVTGRPEIFSSQKLNLSFDTPISFSYGQKTTLLSANAGLKISANQQGNFDTIHFRMRSIDIKDFAKIKKISFDIRSLHSMQQEALIMPSLESHIEIRDIELNGLLKYPLSSKIQRIYIKTNVMGSISINDSLHTGLENWLQNGGFADIQKLVINWNPLTLVGRGSINFNEQLHPRINLNTSSKALIELLTDSQKNGFLDRKGVFVANILLNAKAFKLHKDDKYLTLTTPISYQDNKLAIENVTVKTIKP
ncbi:MAG: DUF2125 domain-containing protein [Alphaproteobacteria bacterium]|nr:DUF2125 domain-containing protein [Alphaproteobacteria bacterium]